MKSWIMLLLVCLLPYAAYAEQGDALAGKSKAASCAACHGADGNSSVPAWPKLAGQHPKYFIAQLRAFQQGKNGTRDQAVMANAVATLVPQDMADIAAYYATQRMTTGSTPQQFVALGEKLYRGGDRQRGIPACTACHEPQGKGNAQAGYPALAGQFAVYTSAQLVAYRKGQRSTDVNEIMRDISAKLNDQDIEALANYIAGLH